jgi:hypothetical protein
MNFIVYQKKAGAIIAPAFSMTNLKLLITAAAISIPEQAEENKNKEQYRAIAIITSKTLHQWHLLPRNLLKSTVNRSICCHHHIRRRTGEGTG